MNKTKQALSLLVVLLLAASSLMMIKTANAQSIPKPSTPTFTLELTNDSVDMKIQNQPIIPNANDTDNTSNIFWNIRIKSHDSENWTYSTVPEPGVRGYVGETSTSDVTELQYPFSSINVLLGLSNDSHIIDYQVEAINGYLNTTYAYAHPFDFDPNSTPVIVVNTSDWSSTRTISVPANVPLSSPSSPIPTSSSSPTSTSTSTPTSTTTSSSPSTSFLLITNTISLIVIAILLAVIIVLLLFMRKRKTANLSK